MAQQWRYQKLDVPPKYVKIIIKIGKYYLVVYLNKKVRL